MFKSLNFNLFCLFNLLLLTLPILTQDFQCDPQNRPTMEECDNQPKEPTCAFYQTNCPVDICNQRAENPCDACSDPSILYYRKEECDPAHFFETCYADICSSDKPLWPGPFYDPVCGFKKDQSGQPVQKTFENFCRVCESDFMYFQRGPCPDDRVYCNPQDPDQNENPDQEDKPVCAVFQAEDSETAYVTVSSSSEACSDSAVEYWIEGRCGDMANGTVYCLPNKRPTICTREFKPVCGYYYENGVLKHKLMDNECTACSDPDFIFHIGGSCISTCFPSEPVLPTTHPNELYPICGTYERDGQEQKVSLTNPNVGCHPTSMPIIRYEEGLCPGHKGIRCEDDNGGLILGYPNPVCGYSTEDCDDDSCRKTYAEPVTACRVGKSIWYSPGPCPGKEGIPCEEDLRGILDLVGGNVCGYSEQGCSDYSCRIDYDTYFHACVFSNMIYVKPGNCNA